MPDCSEQKSHLADHHIQWELRKCEEKNSARPKESKESIYNFTTIAVGELKGVPRFFLGGQEMM